MNYIYKSFYEVGITDHIDGPKYKLLFGNSYNRNGQSISDFSGTV